VLNGWVNTASVSFTTSPCLLLRIFFLNLWAIMARKGHLRPFVLWLLSAWITCRVMWLIYTHCLAGIHSQAQHINRWLNILTWRYVSAYKTAIIRPHANVQTNHCLLHWLLVCCVWLCIPAKYMETLRYEHSGFGRVVVSILPLGTQDRGFALGRSRRIFSGEKILSMPSFGREVNPFAPCRRFAACQRTL
jgi:hypothetical protein